MRVIRILVYEGDQTWIDHCLKTRSVKGSRRVPNGSISETFFYPGDAPAFNNITEEDLLNESVDQLPTT